MRRYSGWFAAGFFVVSLTFLAVAPAATPCDDTDGDGVCNEDDNCPTVPNPSQADADADGLGDVCDVCTDLDADGCGDPGFPANTCCIDNCPEIANPAQEDTDSDGIGDACDPCPEDPTNLCGPCPDFDGDGVCDDEDNCPNDPNPGQEDFDADTLGDVCDPCPLDPTNTCNCPDSDGDGVCDQDDNCEGVPNPGQAEFDGDGLGFGEVAVEFGSTMLYLANLSDPGIGLDWTLEGFVADASWLAGTYGVGYEMVPAGANPLLQTLVPSGAASVFTRAVFEIADVSAVAGVFFGADYDDGVVVWLNGLEVFRSIEMPAGQPAWNAASSPHESSNGSLPDYGTRVDITSVALPLLHDGQNVLGVGVWNSSPVSSDLVLVPQLILGTVGCDNCPFTFNPTQEDTDNDGVGDSCDNCPLFVNAAQVDADGDGLGDVCDCGPHDATGGVPPEVADVLAARMPNGATQFSWEATPTSDRYDILWGDLSDPASAVCVTDQDPDATDEAYVEPANPPAESCWFYLFRGVDDVCGGPGTWGSSPLAGECF